MKSLRWTDYARSAVANKKLSKLRISVWPNCRRQCFISVLPKRSFAFRRKLKLISFSLSYTFAATRTKVASNLRIYVMVLCVAEMCVLFFERWHPFTIYNQPNYPKAWWRWSPECSYQDQHNQNFVRQRKTMCCIVNLYFLSAAF